jgi:hypothetical protein
MKPAGPIIHYVWPNQKQGAAVRSYLLHSSLAGAQLLCAIYQQPQQTQHITQEPNHFRELNRHILTFLYLNLMCRV